MPSLLLKEVEDSGGSGGSYFVPEALQSDNIATNQPLGVVLSVPEVEGKVYKIILLSTTDTSTQGGMSFIVDGVTLSSNVVLMARIGSGADAPQTGFGVAGLLGVDGNATLGARAYREIYCTSFSLEATSFPTSHTIAYAYEIGSFK